VNAYYRIIEWGQYQHYKDRDPPWIKLHRDLLTSQTWVTLADASRVLAVASMLIAAGTDNKIPADPTFIRRRAYLNYDPDFAPLVAVGFVELVNGTNDLAPKVLADASEVLAFDNKRYSESESESEKRREEYTCFSEFLAAADRQNWTKPRKLDPDRRKKLRARLDEHGPAGWSDMLAKAEASKFINESSFWTFDWVLNPKNFRKVIEDNYKNKLGATASEDEPWT